MTKKISILVLMSMLCACDSEKEIRQYSSKTETISQRAFFGAGFSWNPPANWQYRTAQNPMQLAIFLAPEESDTYTENPNTVATVSLSFLKGETGSLNDNIKRWQRQIDINNPINPSENIRTIKTSLGEIQFIKIQNNNTDESILAAVYQQLDGALFVKMRGPIQTINQQTNNFVSFIEDVQHQKGDKI